jgi:hypothetical protein
VLDFAYDSVETRGSTTTTFSKESKMPDNFCWNLDYLAYGAVNERIFSSDPNTQKFSFVIIILV